MISQKGLSEMIDLISEIDKKDAEIQNVFESSGADLLSRYSEKLRDWIMTEVGIPEDNTVEMTEIYGEIDGMTHAETFCRDFYSDWFFEFNEGNLTKEKLIFNLLNWKNISQ